MPTVTPSAAAREYAQLLLSLHELDPHGQKESPELDAICEQMDRPWARMSGRERKRMNSLSEDLYALADGRTGVPMGTEEKRHWEAALAGSEVEDPDVQLERLRGPFPADAPPSMVPFLQAQAWERLGDLDVALVFMRQAASAETLLRVACVHYLILLGRYQEATELANEILADPKAKGAELYIASSALLLLSRGQGPETRRATCARIIPPLRKVIEHQRGHPEAGRIYPPLEQAAARALALALLEVGDRAAVVKLCNEFLGRTPDDAALLTSRAFATLQQDPAAAESDLQRALASRPQAAVPHLLMAWLRLKQGSFAEVLRYSHVPLQWRHFSDRTRACLYEWRGLASIMLGQQSSWVEEEFSQALSLDSASADRINRNRQAALNARAQRAVAGGRMNWSVDPPGPAVMSEEVAAGEMNLAEAVYSTARGYLAAAATGAA